MKALALKGTDDWPSAQCNDATHMKLYWKHMRPLLHFQMYFVCVPLQYCVFVCMVFQLWDLLIEMQSRESNGKESL